MQSLKKENSFNINKTIINIILIFNVLNFFLIMLGMFSDSVVLSVFIGIFNMIIPFISLIILILINSGGN